MKKAKLERYEVEELIAYICGLDYDEVDYNDIEKALWEKFEIEYDRLHQILEILVPMIDVGKNALTDGRYKGFSKEGKGKDWILSIKV